MYTNPKSFVAFLSFSADAFRASAMMGASNGSIVDESVAAHILARFGKSQQNCLLLMRDDL